MRSQGEDHDNSALRVKLTSGIFLYNCDTSSTGYQNTSGCRAVNVAWVLGSREGNLGPLIRLDAENLGTLCHNRHQTKVWSGFSKRTDVIHATRFQHGSISYSRIRSPEKNSYAGLAVSLHLL
jgi:hypothetical protein